MDCDFWLEKWISGDTKFDQGKPNPNLLENWARLVSKPSNVFVPLCGRSIDLRWLSEQGHNVLGVELSAVAIESFFDGLKIAYSKKAEGTFTRYESQSISILEGDFFELSVDHLKEVQAVYDRAWIVAFPPALRAKYAEHLKKIVPKNSPMLVVSLEYPGGLIDGPPFSVDETELCGLYGESSVTKLKDEQMSTSHPKFTAAGLETIRETVYSVMLRDYF